MYGLLLENLSMFIKLQWGEANWDAVRRHAGIDAATFGIHHVYAETLIPRLARSAVAVLEVEENEFFDAMGVYFVEFAGQFGYDQVMSVLGRHLRDFLNGLDNLHEYLKFSFPRMRAPSFFCESETIDGLILHYRSKRRGFVNYTMGQIKQVAKHFYDTDCTIELRSEELDGDTMHVIFQLRFDNRAYIKTESMMNIYRDDQLLPFRTSMLFELFPFCIVFSEDMIIRQTGKSLYLLLKGLVGLCVTDSFEMVRPLIAFTFHSILDRRNNIFELMTVAAINDDEMMTSGSMDEEETGTCLRLKGQMLYIDDWQSMIFLATPVMPDLESLLSAGLFINDLSLHDCSRDLILAGTQQSVELKLALDQEQAKSRKLEDSMKKLDDEMRRTDELLYQMIPRQVADRIRRGENPVDTCEVYDVVSILFSDVVTFTEICSRINPMQVVSMLNHMYSLFDQLTERNGVYKVETIGDAYMVVSGAPNQEVNHAERICDMAMDMVDASMGIFDPSRDGEHLQLRVGVHSGNVVAGVVGLKMPRWCLFGDAVNTSSRMESTSEAGKIQISEKTRDLLPNLYKHEYRGEVAMKGKGMMQTYWLLGRDGRIPLSQLQCNTFSWAAPQMGIYTAEVLPGTPAPAFGKEKSMSISESEGHSKAKSWGSQSQDSVSKHDGILHHQHSEKMNLNAAKQAVNKSLMMRKKTKADAEAKDAAAAEASLSANSPAPTEAAPVQPPPASPAKQASPAKLASPAPQASPAMPTSPAKSVSPAKTTEAKPDAPANPAPKLAKQENVVKPPTVVLEPKTPVKVAEPPPTIKVEEVSPVSKPAAKVVVVEAKSETLPAKAAGERKGSADESGAGGQSRRGSKAAPEGGSKGEGDPASAAIAAAAALIQSSKPDKVEPLSNSTPVSDPAQNQTQENYLIAKATLRRNSTVAKSEGQNDVGTVGRNAAASEDTAKEQEKTANDKNDKTDMNDTNDKNDAKSQAKETFLKRMRGNKDKVALLTSEVMAQMGCSGFGARPKEVVSQTCNLL